MRFGKYTAYPYFALSFLDLSFPLLTCLRISLTSSLCLSPLLYSQDHIKRLPQDESSAVGLHDPGTRQEETAQRSYLSNFGTCLALVNVQLCADLC